MLLPHKPVYSFVCPLLFAAFAFLVGGCSDTTTGDSGPDRLAPVTNIQVWSFLGNLPMDTFP
ncbi:MAG TPA: hypothetical protein DCX46_04540 [Bacteroidetes bacterium]|nr:hypothetical protein [Bacteroidota bacterium]